MPRQKAFGILIYTYLCIDHFFFCKSTCTKKFQLHIHKKPVRKSLPEYCCSPIYIYILYIYRADVFFFEQWSSCNICTIINIPNLSQVPPCKLKQECFCVKLTYFDIYMHGMYMHVPTIWTHTWHQPHYAAGASVALHQPHYDAGAMLMLLTLNLLTHTRC